MDELDFSKGPAKATPPRPAAPPLYNAAMALEFFRSGGKPESAPAGTVFFEENQKAGFLKRDKMYLLLEGDVVLTARGKPIGLVKTGEVFGEMAAISDSPRSATATAKTACRVIALDDKQFQAALKVKPEFALMLMGMMIVRLRIMIARLTRLHALSGDPEAKESRVFDKAMVAALAQGLGDANAARFQRGQPIFREGQTGLLMYVVQEGRVALSIQEHLVERVGPGGVFGEMALVDQSARAASATAETDCLLLGLNRNVFVNLVKSHPEFGASLLAALAERVRFMASKMK
ncbi:MAG TPA: cyclic nucleotide-binding domain-containing protein [Burkholderiales bacterium]|jgi:CRP-like cAMP-binding protein|nr:cyclic nucleotide-binding domain-containing protein [Burkholderiales bacterium]